MKNLNDSEMFERFLDLCPEFHVEEYFGSLALMTYIESGDEYQLSIETRGFSSVISQYVEPARDSLGPSNDPTKQAIYLYALNLSSAVLAGHFED